MRNARDELAGYLKSRRQMVSRLKAWRAGPDRILTLLQQAARIRHEEALRAGDPHVTEDAALWTRIFARLVNWNARFPYGHGDCSQKDAEEVVAFARELDATERLETAISVGAFSVTKSSGLFKLAITQDPAVEAADLMLEALTSPHRYPDIGGSEVNVWLHRLAQGKGATGIPTNVRRSSALWGRKAIEAYRAALPEGSLQDSFTLRGRLTVGNAVQYWAALVGLCYLLDRIAAITRDTRATLMSMHKNAIAARLADAVGEGADLELAQEVVELATFTPGASPLAAPLIPCGDRLIICPALVNPIGTERLLLRAVASDPSRSGKLGKDLGRRASAWGEFLCGIPGVLVAEGVIIKRATGGIAGDLDVVAVDPSAGVGICLEVKWPIDAQSLGESMKITDVTDKGARQLDRLRSFLATGDAIYTLPSGWPRFEEVEWAWVVGTPQQLYAGTLPVHDIHVTSLRYIMQLPKPATLGQLIGGIASPSWPERNRHFEIRPARMRIGAIRIEQETIALMRTPRWSPKYSENGIG
ncbi:hypothetical protein [Microbispora bryophytorum]|uniref:Uncharacterized protein n=1 Tax=Microbispora bryophytorum TaxID=1460882 RepID=A0A8H9LB47_9ACTN|nr:hypothetical protein [Microbispora bryophytorum]MBD3135739.1 hypothetical protein [Microbispora bryophytorum]TQS09902.1 hypothetical protein FLX07_02255 [Microbispora bryophytorum]GGN99220.1 hypothetical protein GCM10011574_04620 [Microbispora bryophytorum]